MERDVADEKDWPGAWNEVRIPFCFVPHGAPEPTEWMARHPNWFKIPATFVPRSEPPPVPAAPGRDKPLPIHLGEAYRGGAYSRVG